MVLLYEKNVGGIEIQNDQKIIRNLDQPNEIKYFASKLETNQI